MRSLRGAFNMVLVAWWTSVYATRALLSRFRDPSGGRVIDLARAWSHRIARSARIQVVVEQRAPLDAAQPYVFMSNHVSNADVCALYFALPVRVRMIAKKSLGRIPFMGWAMRAGRFIFIDRSDPAASRASIDQAAQRIAGGDSVLLFPEGTRSRDGRLGPFKKGGFHLAMSAGVPIVPCAVRGTAALLPRGGVLLRPGGAHVVVGAPIPTVGLSDADRESLLERVRGEIAALLEG